MMCHPHPSRQQQIDGVLLLDDNHIHDEYEHQVDDNAVEENHDPDEPTVEQ